MARKRLKLSDPTAIRKALNRIANMLLNDEISAKKASVLIAACNATLNSVRADEQQKKIDELERLINEKDSL